MTLRAAPQSRPASSTSESGCCTESKINEIFEGLVIPGPNPPSHTPSGSRSSKTFASLSRLLNWGFEMRINSRKSSGRGRTMTIGNDPLQQQSLIYRSRDNRCVRPPGDLEGLIGSFPVPDFAKAERWAWHPRRKLLASLTESTTSFATLPAPPKPLWQN